MAAKLNFWEEFALNAGIAALEALVAQQTSLSPEQAADIQSALTACQKVAADFAG